MENQLQVVIQESGLEQTRAQVILEKFKDYFQLASEWEQKAKTLTVTAEDQKTEMKMAREGRLFLREKRLDVERTRKELKEEYLRGGKAVDSIASILKGLIEPIEEYLESQEKFAERMEEQRRQLRVEERIAKLIKYEVDCAQYDFYDFGDMTEEAFSLILSGAKKQWEDKQAEIERIEKERIAKEKAEKEEQERIKKENERLKKEAEEKERALAEERKQAEAERKRLEEKATRAPDKEKLVQFASMISKIEIPKLQTKEADEIGQNIRVLLGKVEAYILEKSQTL